MVITQTLVVPSTGRGYHEITAAISRYVSDSGIGDGVCSVFIRHTSASLMLCENADGQVLDDLERFMRRLVVDGDPLFGHDAEGPDDMPAHIRSVLTHTDLTLPIRHGRLDIGPWQGVFLWEHRTQAHRRTLSITLLGD